MLMSSRYSTIEIMLGRARLSVVATKFCARVAPTARDGLTGCGIAALRRRPANILPIIPTEWKRDRQSAGEGSEPDDTHEDQREDERRDRSRDDDDAAREPADESAGR